MKAGLHHLARVVVVRHREESIRAMSRSHGVRAEMVAGRRRSERSR